jgi:hypothetical protein
MIAEAEHRREAEAAGLAALRGLGILAADEIIPPSPKPEGDALARVRAWVESEVSDWCDPVIGPDLHDDLRAVVGLPPLDRNDEGAGA